MSLLSISSFRKCYRHGVELISRAAKDTSEAPRERPWQIMLTGPSLEQVDAATRQALERILELLTDPSGR
jgi:hypothetical protein